MNRLISSQSQKTVPTLHPAQPITSHLQPNQWRPSDIFHLFVLPGFRPMRFAAAIQQTGGSAARTWHGHGRTHVLYLQYKSQPIRGLNFDASANESASRQSSDCSSALQAIAYLAATAPWGSPSFGLC
ncbi:hypothetical protein TgHK011_002603 [Trichoderma gracile]|nr:hypothetical protein TgHK011_002603 [Trichoderma gracile]